MEGRIPKKDKPDFECMTSLTIQGNNILMVAGSGSISPQRDTAYLITLQPSYSYKDVSLTKLYNQLRNMPEVVATGKLNTEGIAASHDKIFLLQRGNFPAGI